MGVSEVTAMIAVVISILSLGFAYFSSKRSDVNIKNISNEVMKKFENIHEEANKMALINEFANTSHLIIGWLSKIANSPNQQNEEAVKELAKIMPKYSGLSVRIHRAGSYSDKTKKLVDSVYEEIRILMSTSGHLEGPLLALDALEEYLSKGAI